MLKSTQKPKGVQSKSKTYFGNHGEDLAADFLASQNYKIIARNFHSRFGEIDIVATKDSTLVFVEVKTRWSSKFGTPVEAVTEAKIQNIQKTINYFVLLNQNLPKKHLIEVLSVDLTNSKTPEFKIFKVF